MTHKRLYVEAPGLDTEIWVGDEEGNFVQKEMGVLDTKLLPGKYTVQFGLGTTIYDIDLQEDIELDPESIRKLIKEDSAKDVRGCFLYNPFTGKHFFRIYNPTNRSKFKDYSMDAEEIWVKIESGDLSLFDDGKLSWSSKTLGIK
jgi:hypothetical protein